MKQVSNQEKIISSNNNEKQKTTIFFSLHTDTVREWTSNKATIKYQEEKSMQTQHDDKIYIAQSHKKKEAKLMFMLWLFHSLFDIIVSMEAKRWVTNTQSLWFNFICCVKSCSSDIFSQCRLIAVYQILFRFIWVYGFYWNHSKRILTVLCNFSIAIFIILFSLTHTTHSQHINRILFRMKNK